MIASQVTVVVPTKNESANIVRLLRSVAPDTPLVVVDSSTDDTPAVIRAARPRNTTIIRAALGIAAARQCGAEAANTPWVLCTDADVEFGPSYFHVLGRVCVDATYGGIVGTKLTAGGFEGYHKLFRSGQGLLSHIGVPAATGSNMLVSAAALRAVGGFDIGLSVNEDTEVMFRIKRAGYHVGFRPELEVLAFDHRRLERGPGRKLLHSVGRSALLWAGCMPRSWRATDWGYWDPPDRA